MKPNAKSQRDRALAKYLANPKICKECSIPIKVKPNERVGEVRKRDFCDRSCAASYNNRTAIRSHGPQRKPRVCRTCDAKHLNGGTFCSPDCREVDRLNRKSLGDRTKGEVFANCSSWQSARAVIQKHARAQLSETACSHCGYAIHVDAAHVRAVSTFPDSATISMINDKSNLRALCRNHHWEYDHGLLAIQ